MSPRWAPRRSPASHTSRPPRVRNERFHQTLFRYLDKQPLAATLAQLQVQIQIDAFDHLYDTERPHQGLPGRTTPLTAWEATAKADPPHPKPDRPVYRPQAYPPAPASGRSTPPESSVSTTCPTRSTSRTLSDRSSSSATATDPATRSSSPTSTARSSPNAPDPLPASATSATADPADDDRSTRERHPSPDTPTVTDVLMQNCHRCPETSHACHMQVGTAPSRTVRQPRCNFRRSRPTPRRYS